jgi:hypothetical protein
LGECNGPERMSANSKTRTSMGDAARMGWYAEVTTDDRF